MTQKKQNVKGESVLGEAISPSERVSEVIRQAQISNVFLKSCNSDCISGPGAISPSETALSTDYEHRWELSPDRKTLACFIGMKLTGSKDEDDLFWIHATFAAIYDLQEDNSLIDEAIEAFTRTNAFYNVYPYLRELLQNIMVRMGIPGFPLPLLKPMTKKDVDGSSTDSRANPRISP